MIRQPIACEDTHVHSRTTPLVHGPKHADGCARAHVAAMSDAEWLLGEWAGTTALKGVCRSEDARRAVEMGFDCIWVSNHGGRQLETSPPTIQRLPEIRAAVGPDVNVIVDGGVTRAPRARLCPSTLLRPAARSLQSRCAVPPLSSLTCAAPGSPLTHALVSSFDHIATICAAQAVPTLRKPSH